MGIRFGVALQNYVAAGESISFRDLIDAARLAEELGYSSVWVWDHLILGSRRFYPIHESLIVLSAVAAHTEQVKLGTGVFLLALRNPVVVAKQVAALDHLSNGRVVFGVAAGWYEREFRACGVPFGRRGEVLETNVEILKRLWSEESVSGRYGSYEFSNVRLEPKPVQKPHPPIWMGGYVEKALMRIGRIADGWVSYFYTPESFKKGWEKILSYARQSGRDVSKLSNCVMLPALLARDRRSGLEAVSKFVEKYCDLPPWSEASVESALTGSARECVEYAEQFARSGAEELVLMPVFSNISEIREKVRELSDSVIHSF
ncbi:MAG: TIGR03619 family F420-dependent LLM class oxidoreductase [Aigarchaeota archaeon]|nr:TIGR03619 family F420-dependent LLM class oxidoreductase [Candidatus Pelearchaeum maunauluense]